jgi:hypothetical protein
VTGIFGPSPDGFTNRPIQRGPTETEFQTAYDVLEWAKQFTFSEGEEGILSDALLILTMIDFEASGK